MGRSGKPGIEYRFVDHARYLERFIEALELTNLTLVTHDWGAALGLDYASRHPAKVRAVAMMEGLYRPVSWREQTWLNRWMFRRLRHPLKGERMIVDNNFFVEKVLPMMTRRKLTAAEMERYREPFLARKCSAQRVTGRLQVLGRYCREIAQINTPMSCRPTGTVCRTAEHGDLVTSLAQSGAQFLNGWAFWPFVWH